MARNKVLHSIPHVINGYCLHTGTMGTGLHLTQKKAGPASWMTPEGGMLWIVERVRSIFLWTGGAEDSDHRNTYRCGKMHGAAVIADKERTLLQLGCHLSKSGLTRHVDNSICRAVQVFCQL